MKTCAYCGRENQDEATHCSECATELKSSQPTTLPPDPDKDFVTVARCRNLPEADVIVTHLEGAGIQAFIPDECALQNAAFILTPGNVRVQVARGDYDSAKELLQALSKDPETNPETDAWT